MSTKFLLSMLLLPAVACGGTNFDVAEPPAEAGDGGVVESAAPDGGGEAPVEAATDTADAGVDASTSVVLVLPPMEEAPPGDQTFSVCPASPSDVCIYEDKQGAITTSPVGFLKVSKVRVKATVKARVEGMITTGICADSSPLVLELRFGTQGFAAVVLHRWTLTSPGTYDLDLTVGDVVVDYMLSGRKPFVTLDTPTRRGTALGCGTVRVPKGAFSVELVP